MWIRRTGDKHRHLAVTSSNQIYGSPGGINGLHYKCN